MKKENRELPDLPEDYPENTNEKTDLKDQTDDDPKEGVIHTENEIDNKTNRFVDRFHFTQKDSSAGNSTDSSSESTGGNGFKARISDILSNPKVCLGSMTAALLFLLCALSSCSVYSKADELRAQIKEKDEKISEQADEIKKLEAEKDELINGPSRLLEKVEAARDDKNWEQTIEAAGALHEAYPGSSEDKKGQEMKQLAESEIKKAEEAKRKEEEQKKKEEERKKAEEQKKKEEEERKKAEEEARGYETGITYDQLARYPDENIGKKVKFYGKVIQSMKDEDGYTIRLAVDDNYDQIIIAYYKDSITKGKVLENDYITIYGTSYGDYTYEAVMGNKITLPMVSIEKIDQ